MSKIELENNHVAPATYPMSQAPNPNFCKKIITSIMSSNVEHHPESNREKVDVEIGMIGCRLCNMDTVRNSAAVRIVEPENTNIHLYGRIVVQKARQTRSETHMELEITLVSTREILPLSVGDFRLSASKCELHLVEKTETRCLPQRYIHAHQPGAQIALANTVEIVYIVVCF